ncbi:MAG: hypothetical protein ABI182_08955 [Candidatus Baltobacteraceae bacterium]
MNDWVLAGTTFVASVVECVEAVTIVLAVGYTQSWRSALSGAAWALLVLAVIAGVLGPALVRLVPLHALQLAVGLFLVLFGYTWLRKAIWRYSGRKALHDEDAIYAREVAALEAAKTQAHAERIGFATSFNGVLLEGLEVIVIVITFGAASIGGFWWASAGALAAVVLVCAAGLALRKPFGKVPENTMKFVVGIMLLSFGTFWSGEGLSVTWWAGESTLPTIIAVYLALSGLVIATLRTTRKPVSA